MHNKPKIYNGLTIVAFILAIVCGLYIPNFINNISFIGNIYINLLKFIISPLIFTSIVTTIYKTKEKKANLLSKTILVFIIMFTMTFLITSIIVLIIKPGINFNFNEIAWTGKIENLRITDIITNIFPTNIITMFQNNSLLAIILFSFVFGLAATKTDNSKNIMQSIETIRNIFYKILEYIMCLTPIAIFSLVGTMIANYKFVVFEISIRYILTAYICSTIVLTLIMMLPVCIIKKISPFQYFKKMHKLFIIALTTCSSIATLPTTIKTCKEKFNVKSTTTDIVVPLGCTIHMCGGAVSFALLAILCCQYMNISIDISTYIIMLLSATAINMAAPGIPNGGIVIGATYLSILNIPLTFIGLYSSIYKLLDMAYTTLNVTGDVTANIIIDKYKCKNN